MRQERGKGKSSVDFKAKYCRINLAKKVCSAVSGKANLAFCFVYVYIELLALFFLLGSL